MRITESFDGVPIHKRLRAAEKGFVLGRERMRPSSSFWNKKLGGLLLEWIVLSYWGFLYLLVLEVDENNSSASLSLRLFQKEEGRTS